MHPLLRYLCLAVLAGLLLACTSPAPTPGPALPAEQSLRQGEQQTVALLGATGMVGAYLLREALARDLDVRVLARTPAKLEDFRDRITIVQGDARDPAVIRELLRGSDVVISALGPVKADGEAAEFVSTIVTGNVLREMKEASVSRLIVVSGAGVVLPGDDRNLLGWWIRKLAQVGLRAVLQDKQAEYDVLFASDAEWTLIRCPLIDEQPYLTNPAVSLKTPPAFHLRAPELARFAIDQIEDRAFVRQGPFLGSYRRPANTAD